MKKILILFYSLVITFLGFSFALDQEKLNKLEKEIQNKYGVSIEIRTDIPKEKAKKTTADILFWINFKEHKMQDFVRESLSPIFTHSDTDSCRNKIKPILRKQQYQLALETYLKCIDNVLNKNITEIINRGKKVGVNIETYNLFKIKRKIEEIRNKEKEKIEKEKIKEQLKAKQKELEEQLKIKQKQLEEEKKAKEEMKKSIEETKKSLRGILNLILLFSFLGITFYLIRGIYLKSKINNLLKTLDKNLIYLKNVNYIDVKDYINEINILKEEVLNIKKNLWFSSKIFKGIEEIENKVNKINEITLETIDSEKNIEKKTEKLNEKFHNLFK